MTFARAPRLSTAASKAPSSGRRCTPADSRCRRRLPRWRNRTSMALDDTDLEALVAQAAKNLDAAAKPFVEGHRAESAVQKKGNDFATEVDLAIERQVVEALTAETGIQGDGERCGGADADSPLVWVLDPIDGTFNYAAGSPMAAILLGLVRDGEPGGGLTWGPFRGGR